jgi:hypothetical protein
MENLIKDTVVFFSKLLGSVSYSELGLDPLLRDFRGSCLKGWTGYSDNDIVVAVAF